MAVIHSDHDMVVPPPAVGEGLAITGHGHRSILASAESARSVVDHLLAEHDATGRHGAA
jgi:hypothetical protein